jgi:excisionase family DNA binding protein
LNINLFNMYQTVLISLPIEELQVLITDCIARCLKDNASPSNNDEQPITTKELCNFLGITEPTILRWRKKGKIPFLQVGSRILYQKAAVIAALGNKKGVKA